MATKQQFYCEKCNRTKDEGNFYQSNNREKYPEGRLHQCKECVTMHVDNWDPNTYTWILQECDVPYIYDNGLLLEALSWYILFKYLSRGSKHQVYSLTSPNPVLNPFTQWNTIKSKAEKSVAIDLAKDTDGWRNFFFNSTFDPRR